MFVKWWREATFYGSCGGNVTRGGGIRNCGKWFSTRKIKHKITSKFICGVKRGSIKSDRILGFVSSNSVWQRSIMGCMELHGFSFELCIWMGMAARIDEGRWQVDERRIGSGWQGRFWRSFWNKQRRSEEKDQRTVLEGNLWGCVEDKIEIAKKGIRQFWRGDNFGGGETEK